MPGIVGLITEMPREWAEPQLRRMVESLCHEPSYRTGTWVEESLGLYVGWAIQKDTFADGIPVCNERGDLVLVFAGEEYPEKGINSKSAVTPSRQKGLPIWFTSPRKIRPSQPV